MVRGSVWLLRKHGGAAEPWRCSLCCSRTLRCMSVTFVLLDDLTHDPIPEPIGWRQDAQVRKFYDVCQVLPPVIVMSCSPRLDDADAEQARTP